MLVDVDKIVVLKQLQTFWITSASHLHVRQNSNVWRRKRRTNYMKRSKHGRMSIFKSKYLNANQTTITYIKRMLTYECYRAIHKSVKHVRMRWPPRSPDLNLWDFFFWGYVKDTVFVPPLPAKLQIFATVSLLLWLWSTMICRNACGTRWTTA